MQNKRARNLVLVGFMGAGKSTLGKLLAQRLGWRFIDLDHVIEARAGRSIKEIFSASGEETFRDLESAVLHSLLELERCVIATGGGVVGRAENWVAMRQLGPIVYLSASWEVLISRLDGCSDRPLAGKDQGVERIRQLHDSRLALYRQADLTVDTGRGDPAYGVADIVSYLEERGIWRKI